MLAKQKPIQSFFASLNPFSSLLASSSTPEVDARSSSQKLTDEEKLQVIERSVQLQIYTGDITVKLPPKIASEIERATRKKSPSNITYQIIYVCYSWLIPQTTLAANDSADPDRQGKL